MRILLGAALCAITLALAGCGAGGGDDNEMRAAMREQSISSCVAAARTSARAGQYDWPRLCSCATDRYMAGKSTSDLRNVQPHDPARQAASRQCAIEQMSATLEAIANGQAENSAAPGN
jgi:hypothetical protein